jgi:hypothetical protein
VTAATIAGDAITSSKVKNGSIQRSDLAPGVLRRGSSGPVGSSGEPGPGGVRGASGLAGHAGAVGLSGPQGQPGIRGPVEPVGPSPAGPTGPTGTKGPPGPLPALRLMATIAKDASGVLSDQPDFKVEANCGGTGGTSQLMLVRKTRFSFDGMFVRGGTGEVDQQADRLSVGGARNAGDANQAANVIVFFPGNQRAFALATIWTDSGIYGLKATMIDLGDTCYVRGLLIRTRDAITPFPE